MYKRVRGVGEVCPPNAVDTGDGATVRRGDGRRSSEFASSWSTGQRVRAQSVTSLFFYSKDEVYII